MAEVRSLLVRLGVSTDPRGFKNAEKNINQLKTSAVSLGRLFATGAVAVGFKKLIDAASESAEAANKFGAVFKESSDEIQKQVDDIANRTKQSSLEIGKFAANIGALVKPALGSSKAAGELGTRVAELAFDVASFNDVSPEEALVALRSGLIGSAEPLQRFGVDVRVAALEQEALRQGIKGSIKELSEGQRVQLRTSAILRQLGKQGALGDATTTADAFANSSRAVAGRMKELAATIGSFLLGPAGDFLAVFRSNIKRMQEFFKANKEIIGQRVDRFFDRVSRVMKALFSVTGRIIGSVRDWLQNLTPVQEGLLNIIKVAGILAAILLLPGGSLLLLGALVGLIIEDFERWREGGESVIGDLVGSLEMLAAEFPTIAMALVVIKDTFISVFDFITNMVGSFVNLFIEMFTVGPEQAMANFSQLVTQAFAELFGEDSVLGNVLSFFADSITDTFKTVAEVIGTTFGFLFSQLGALFDGDFSQMFSNFKTFVLTIFETIGGAIGRQFDRLKNVAGAVGRFLGVGSGDGSPQSSVSSGVAQSIKASQAVTAGSASATGGVSTVDRSTKNFNITVNATPGMDERALSQMVADKIGEAEDRRNKQTIQSFVTEAP